MNRWISAKTAVILKVFVFNFQGETAASKPAADGQQLPKTLDLAMSTCPVRASVFMCFFIVKHEGMGKRKAICNAI